MGLCIDILAFSPTCSLPLRVVLASRSPQWRKHKNLVRAYLANLLHFTRQLVEPSMLGFVLKAVELSLIHI